MDTDVTVVALLIAGLLLWVWWRDRKKTATEKVKEIYLSEE